MSTTSVWMQCCLICYRLRCIIQRMMTLSRPTNSALELAVVLSTWLLQELRDESKVTHYYLESMNGMYSASVVSEEERKTAIGIDASNNISKSVHGMSTQNMQQFSTIRFDSCAAGGQQNSNGDWDRDHAALIRR